MNETRFNDRGEPFEESRCVLSRLRDHQAVFDSRLTEREYEVIRLAAAGTSNAEIADALSVSFNTVKTHFQHIFTKLGVHDRRTAVERVVPQPLWKRRPPDTVACAHAPITPRQREVLQCAAVGMTNAEIAASLSVSQNTVKSHMHEIFKQLGVRSRRAAVAAATSADSHREPPPTLINTRRAAPEP